MIFFVASWDITGQSLDKIDSLKKLLPAVDSNRFSIFFGIYKSYYSLNQDSAFRYANLSLEAALKVGDSLGIVRSLHSLGDIHVKQGNYTKGIRDLEIALAVANRNGFLDRSKYILNILAIANINIANYDKALAYNFQSLRIREESGNQQEISVAENNIGIVYLSLEDYENALQFFERSLATKLKYKITHDIERCYINIGLAANGLGQLEKSISNLRRVFELCLKNCDPQIVMEAHNALGEAYLASKDLEQARNEFLKSLQLAEELSSTMYKSMALNSLSRVSIKVDSLDRALEFVNQSQDLVRNSAMRDQNLRDFAILTEIYRKKGNYQLASYYQERYIDLNKEIFQGDLIRNISRIQSAYAERENLKTIAAKDQILNLQTDIIARQKSEYAFIITITFLVMGLALVMYRANQSQRKTNQQLAQAKETIQHQNSLLSNTNQMLESEVQERTKELFQTNESLIKVNEEMDNFIYKTSHDIRGPLATLKGMCNVAMVDVKDELALTYLQKLDTSAAKLNAILSRLLIINQINHSLLNPEYIKFEDQIEEIIALETKKGLPARLKVSYEVEDNLNFRSDKEMTRIILENLIDNAIKFYNDSQRIDPFVRVRVFSEGENVVVKVTDNGIGIDESSRSKIFNLFVRASERSDSGGIGLYLSRLATTKLGGTIEFTPTADNTTEFTVTFPRDLLAVLEERRAEELKREKQQQNSIKKA